MAEFRILGAVEIDAAGGPIDAGPPRQRTVLAALLVDAGRLVTLETLVDRVWGDTPPKEVRQAVYSHVARVRRLLVGVTPPAPLRSRSGGYLLDVEPDRVDLHRFTGLVARAREPGCPEERRVVLLRTALDCWHGEPLAGLTGEWATRMRAAWRQQHLDAMVTWARAELRAGDPAATIGPLTDLIGAFPLAESLVAALMRALHASGRPADALDRYADMRRRLADELGADPGAELRAVHQAILRGDPEEPVTAVTVAAAAPKPQPKPPPTPAQLPLDVYGFAGRRTEIARLDAILDKGYADDGSPDGPTGRPTAVVISAISGTAGVGKTALAVHWAHRVRDEFPDGQLYVNLRGFDPGGTPMAPAEAIRGFLDALDVAAQRVPAGLPAQSALYRSLLAGRRVLVVLDNARDAEQVRPLLPGSRTTLVLVTSRSLLASLVAVEGARPLVLDLLPVTDAYDLLARRLGSERLAAEPAAAEEIVARCSRLPLALAIVAARAAVQPERALAALAAELSDPAVGLDALAGEDAVSDVRAVFSWSYRQLSPAAQGLFRLLGLHPGPDLAAAAAASLVGVPVDRLRPALAELTRSHLVTEHTPGRYRFHDLLRAYAAELAATPGTAEDRHAAVHRLLDHYLYTAHAAAVLQNPHRDPITLPPPVPGVYPERLADAAAALAWFSAEHAVLVGAVRQAAADGFDTHTWQLAWSLMTFLDRQGHWYDMIASQEAALAATRRLGDPASEALTHRFLAHGYGWPRRYDEAECHLEQALAIYRRLGDHTGQAHSHHALSILYGRQGDDAAALRHSQQALELYRAGGHRIGEAGALNDTGWYAAQLGDHERALGYCRQALTLQRQLGDRYGEASTWDSIGYSHHQLGDYDEAAACYRGAIDIHRELGDRYYEAATLTKLGDALDAAGGVAGARAVWQQALAIFDDLEHADADRIRAKLRDREHLGSASTT